MSQLKVPEKVIKGNTQALMAKPGVKKRWVRKMAERGGKTDGNIQTRHMIRKPREWRFIICAQNWGMTIRSKLKLKSKCKLLEKSGIFKKRGDFYQKIGHVKREKTGPT